MEDGIIFARTVQHLTTSGHSIMEYDGEAGTYMERKKKRRGIEISMSHKYHRGRKLSESRRGEPIGKLVIIDIRDDETAFFDEVMALVDRYPGFDRCEVRVEAALRFPGLVIYPERRKIYRGKKEVKLTAKEFDILCLLAVNRGKVVTYGQIYEQVWGDYVQDIENNTIGYHICHLKGKLSAVGPCQLFDIRCVRSVGYCFELLAEEKIV